MASFNIHLAVAKLYSSKNKVEDVFELYKGSIDPDLIKDKSISHYTNVVGKDNLITYLQNKVILNDFLKKNDINNDYQKGIFLHLITDYLFFNDFFTNDYLKDLSYNDFIHDLYYSYDCTNEYLANKYDLKEIIEKLLIDETFPPTLNATNILEQTKLDEFIERVSSINLEEYKNRLIEANQNIKP